MGNKKKKTYIMLTAIIAAVCLLGATCFGSLGMGKHSADAAEETASPAGRLVFDADSAYGYCAAQCAFGPRVMNTEAHDKCGEWIKGKFREFGCVVESQKADLKGYDGTVYHNDNIIARLNPDATSRLLICAHWDSRPWADNDPDEANHRKPVVGANDGASGVAVMLELARMLNADSLGVKIGIDFVCFDAEDCGTPQWADTEDDASTWALGAQHWAKTFAQTAGERNWHYEYGILLDMVGGEGAKFYKEGFSKEYAPDILDKVWGAASAAGCGSYFVDATGGYITDDHEPVNKTAGVKCVDIIAYYPDCPQSSFGPTWHTVDDTMDHISVGTLRAVGQTMAQLLSEY